MARKPSSSDPPTIDLPSLFSLLFPGNSGSNKTFLCPFHTDTHNSLSFFTATDGRQRFHCFGAGCGASGDAIDMVQAAARLDGHELTWREAIGRLAELTGKKLSPRICEHYRLKAEQRDRQKLLAGFLRDQLLSSSAGKLTREWLVERGIPESSWPRMPIGFFPGQEALRQWAQSQEIPEAWLIEQRSIGGGPKWERALAFLYSESFGEFGRIKLRIPRTKETIWLGQKGEEIGFFGLSAYNPRLGDGSAVLVEGEFDLLVPWALALQAGTAIPNILCRSGSAAKTPEALAKLAGLGITRIIALGDNDSAGQDWNRDMAAAAREADMEASVSVPSEYLSDEDPALLALRLGNIKTFADAVITGIRDPFSVEREQILCPPLSFRMSISSASACPWLDQYIQFSRRWSPRAYEGFHEACGIWLLSVIAARRVVASLGKERYTGFYVLLISRTSIWAKTTTAQIAIEVIRNCGLGHLLAPDESTPQAFQRFLTGQIPDDYFEINDRDVREEINQRLAMAGQKGWFYEEFGQHLSAMLREGGFMADFRGLLRKLDDFPPAHEYLTTGRGSERVDRPYLALLGCLTPADFRQANRKGEAMWHDGYWSRFALVAAPAQKEGGRERFPPGARVIPPSLLKPLVEWHQRLGMDMVEVRPGIGGDAKKLKCLRFPCIQQQLALPSQVYDAFYEYDDALHSICAQSETGDMALDGHYHRFSEKALRIALLFASFSGAKEVGMNHWARAQEIAERWRQDLHRLMSQLGDDDGETSKEQHKEAKIRQICIKLGNPSVRDVRKYYPVLSSSEIQHFLDSFVRAGEAHKIEACSNGKPGRKPVRYLFDQ